MNSAERQRLWKGELQQELEMKRGRRKFAFAGLNNDFALQVALTVMRPIFNLSVNPILSFFCITTMLYF
jgi:hypothetical protein